QVGQDPVVDLGRRVRDDRGAHVVVVDVLALQDGDGGGVDRAGLGVDLDLPAGLHVLDGQQQRRGVRGHRGERRVLDAGRTLERGQRGGVVSAQTGSGGRGTGWAGGGHRSAPAGWSADVGAVRRPYRVYRHPQGWTRATLRYSAPSDGPSATCAPSIARWAAHRSRCSVWSNHRSTCGWSPNTRLRVASNRLIVWGAGRPVRTIVPAMAWRTPARLATGRVSASSLIGSPVRTRRRAGRPTCRPRTGRWSGSGRRRGQGSGRPGSWAGGGCRSGPGSCRG